MNTAQKSDNNQRSESTVKTVGLVMLIMLVGKVTGLLREIILNGKMGTESMARTAFEPALSIPSQFLDFAFAAALSSSFIPVFNYYLEKKTKKEAFGLANRFITLVLSATIVIVVLAIFFAPQLIGFFVQGLTDPDTKALAVQLLKIMLPTIAMTAAAFSMTGVLQSLGEFNVPAAMSVLSNLIIIFYFLFLYDTYGVIGLTISFLIGWGTQILIQVPSLLKRGYLYKPDFHFKDPGIKEIGVLMLPIIVSTWVQPVNTMVNRNVASQLYNATGMNALSAASSFYSVITGVFILSIANVIFPKLARQTTGGDDEGFARTINASLRVGAFMLIPMSVGLCLLGEPVIRLFYERGNFTAVSTERSALALVCYSAGMVGLGLQTILSRGFYAVKDAKTPFITSVIAIAVNGALSPVLLVPLGVGGPALAASISINVIGLIMLLVMRRRDKKIFDAASLSSVARMAVSAVVMGVFVYFVSCYMQNGKDAGFLTRLFVVGIPVTVGIIVYMLTAWFLKIDEARIFFTQLKIVLQKLMKKTGVKK